LSRTKALSAPGRDDVASFWGERDDIRRLR
jgi:hypothetical protein